MIEILSIALAILAVIGSYIWRNDELKPYERFVLEAWDRGDHKIAMDMIKEHNIPKYELDE